MTTYNVTFNRNDGCELTGDDKAIAGQDYSVNIRLDYNYELGVVTVRVGDKLLSSELNEYSLEDNKLTINGVYIVNDIKISCTAYLKVEESYISGYLSSNHIVKEDHKNNCT
jgi:hypothetical protein